MESRELPGLEKPISRPCVGLGGDVATAGENGVVNLEAKSNEELLTIIREASALLDSRTKALLKREEVPHCENDGFTYHFTARRVKNRPEPRLSKFTKIDGRVVEVFLPMKPVAEERIGVAGSYQVADGDVVCLVMAAGWISYEIAFRGELVGIKAWRLLANYKRPTRHQDCFEAARLFVSGDRANVKVHLVEELGEHKRWLTTEDGLDTHPEGNSLYIEQRQKLIDWIDSQDDQN